MSSSRVRPFLQTTIGKKYLMGVTGLIWTLFVLAHMVGNILIFVGEDAYNSYSHFLTKGTLIYFVEGVLILSIISHIVLAISLTVSNRSARGGQNYAVSASGEKTSSWASKNMAAQGTLILAFIISHIATLKYGMYYETTVNGVVMRDIFRLIVEIFKQPFFLLWYGVSLVCVGIHLSHGVNSIFQSFGLRNERFAPLVHKLGLIYALIVAVGFLSQPIYVYFFVNNLK